MRSSRRPLRASEDPAQLGGRIGPRIAEIVSKAMHDHLLRSAHTRSRIAAEGANEFFRGMGREKADHLAPFLGLWLGNEATPPELEKVLRFIHHGQGELSELLTTLATAQGLSTPIGAAVSNWLAPTNQYYIAKNPHALLPAMQAAQAQVIGIVGEDWAAEEAAKQGIDSYRYELMTILAQNWPSLGETIQLLRRSVIDEPLAITFLRHQGYSEDRARELLHLTNVPLSPEDNALMVLKGIVTEEEAIKESAESGADPEQVRKLIHMTGEPIGLMQLLEGYRRGYMDEKRLEHGVRQSRIRNEWMDVILNLREVPAATSDAIRGLVQNHLPRHEAEQIAYWNGLRKQDFNWLYETAGNPPSPGELYQLWNRGIISEAEVKQGLREGRLKDKYIDHVVNLHERLLPERQVMMLVQRDAMSLPDALHELHKYGYGESTAHHIVTGGLHATTQRERVATEAEVVRAYEEGLVSEEELKKLLEGLGYHATTAELLIHTSNLKQEFAYRRAAVGQIRSMYIGRHITEQQASSDLDSLTVHPEQRDYLLSLWSIDRAAHRRLPTEAQVAKAYKYNIIGEADAVARLEAMGYTADDAAFLLKVELA